MQTLLSRPATCLNVNRGGVASTSRHRVVQVAAFNGYAEDPWQPSNRQNSPKPPRASAQSSSSPSSSSIRDFDGKYGNGESAPKRKASSSSSSSTSSSAASQPRLESLLMDLSSEEIATVKLFQDNSPSVINVSTTIAAASFFPFNVMQVPRGVGSGFVWDTQGHAVTNAHVLQGANDVSVTMFDQTVTRAKVIGKDREKDIAVLKLELPPERLAQLRPVKLGSSSNLLVGQKVWAIGNPFGLDQTLSGGVVSGLGREIGSPSPMGVPISNVIQTDAAINPGNSGGPLLDSKGRLVGINTAILDPTGRGISSGVGFAIPIDSVKGMVEQILKYGRILRPALGITLGQVPQFLQASVKEGVLVVNVRPGGPADVAGVQPTRRDVWGNISLGDTITAINGQAVRKQKDLFAALDSLRVGDTVEVTLSRDNSTRTVRITLADREKLQWSE